MIRRPATEAARPEPPERPLPGDCCDGGCDPCIHDLYAEALARYAQALTAWEAARSPDDRAALERDAGSNR